MDGRATPVKTTRAASKKNKTMRHMLFTSVIGAVIYAIVAFLVVLVSSGSDESLWAPLLIYVGPFAYFIAIASKNRFAFRRIESTALRWSAFLGACILMTGVFSFLVFVMAVNVHLALGGRL